MFALLSYMNGMPTMIKQTRFHTVLKKQKKSLSHPQVLCERDKKPGDALDFTCTPQSWALSFSPNPRSTIVKAVLCWDLVTNSTGYSILWQDWTKVTGPTLALYPSETVQWEKINFSSGPVLSLPHQFSASNLTVLPVLHCLVCDAPNCIPLLQAVLIPYVIFCSFLSQILTTRSQYLHTA